MEHPEHQTSRAPLRRGAARPPARRGDPLFHRDPLLDPIRSDPEFIQIMAELKRQWERPVQEYE